jgi:hypothetical protein
MSTCPYLKVTLCVGGWNKVLLISRAIIYLHQILIFISLKRISSCFLYMQVDLNKV